MKKTKSCRRKEVIVIGLLLTEIAFMLFVAIREIHATSEEVPTVTIRIRSVDHVNFTEEMMNQYVQDMNPDAVDQTTKEIGSTTPQEFLRIYVKNNPQFEQVLEEKYHITTKEKDFYK